MPEAQLTAGPIDYLDTGGDLPTVVLVGGLAIGSSLWDGVVEGLRRDFRCIVPTLPWGAHRKPMRPDADLSLLGQARILGDFLEALDLRAVTLVENDSAMVQVLVTEQPDRIDRVVFCSCETSGNYPPGLPGKSVALVAKVPGGLNVAMQQMRLGAFRRSPMGLGWMAKRPIPDEMVDDWFRPLLTQRAIRRDLNKYLRSVRPSRKVLQVATEGLRSLDRPALVVWASEDRVMPVAAGRRLAETIPGGRFVEIDDSYTLVPLDQPERLTGEIRAFVGRQRPDLEPDPRGGART